MALLDWICIHILPFISSSSPNFPGRSLEKSSKIVLRAFRRMEGKLNPAWKAAGEQTAKRRTLRRGARALDVDLARSPPQSQNQAWERKRGKGVRAKY